MKVWILGLQTVMLYCHFIKFIHGNSNNFNLKLYIYFFYISSQLIVPSVRVKIIDPLLLEFIMDEFILCTCK